MGASWIVETHGRNFRIFLQFWNTPLSRAKREASHPAAERECEKTSEMPSRTRNGFVKLVAQVAQVAQIFGRVNTLLGYVRTESVSAEFSTTASEP